MLLDLGPSVTYSMYVASLDDLCKTTSSSSKDSIGARKASVVVTDSAYLASLNLKSFKSSFMLLMQADLSLIFTCVFALKSLDATIKDSQLLSKHFTLAAYLSNSGHL